MGLLFTYGLTYGGAVVSLFNPFYGLLIYICFAIIKPPALWHWSVPAGNYSRIIAIALLVGWALQGFGRWDLGRAALPLKCLIFSYCWAAISGLLASDSNVAFAFIEAQTKIVLPVVVGASLITTQKQLVQLAWVMALSQGFVAYELNMSYFSGFNQLELYGFGSMDNNSATIALVTGTGLAFFVGLSSSWVPLQLIAFASAAFMTHAVFFSFSRGGMVALIAVGVASVWIIPKQPKFIVLVALGVVGAAMMAGPEVLREFSSSFAEEEELDWAAESRVHLWKIALKMTQENPLLGVGPDHYPLHVHEYPTGLAEKPFFGKGKEAHSLWMQQMAETGVPGVMALSLFYFFSAFGLYRVSTAMLREENSFWRFLPGMVLPSLTGFVVAAQFVSLEGLELPYYIALLGFAGLRVYGSLPESDESQVDEFYFDDQPQHFEQALRV